MARPRTARSPADTQRRLRSCLGRFATGVTVITFDGPSGRHGFTANSFTGVSMDPPLVLVSVANAAKAHRELPERPFTVNVLGAEQQALALHFAGRPQAEPAWDDTGSAPKLVGALAHLECRPWRTCEAGDHTLHIGEVVDFDYRGGDLLGFANSRFTTITEPLLGMENLL
ncbi:NADH-FMN oxidoreductase RutF, flavin reductase (DIM6/NTAB) family [Saccharopolyspora antimicrobica]|uniref:Flavin reductase (DIM6/NTAB) family NADH-FMN oxidoreductase RutF n=2 Tax=Saccharopolyspora TaxID=1835 RepID=A0A1I4RTZ9_9PSEU|nr:MULTISPECIES: flavin reductase family protein [Saccharopolyspora]RKT87876.1 flavin reductase (DIM6/NTAB) family NADH-FMN oxidoreductase RutF [Saccharopolyspora antimicrobica]SEF92721.1 NADH-FMN oxidoreductase RutF, flavin reductase (DIM6/NTAB) family [Saccharopolyspora kobensis]SFD71011.1 NADH-FMN oxidoreductase RutF, flavin reductase (DIM6/NTAB) family [Saccharopolyspora kobensis]SFM55717.1 NADH-FMN oxidoreductase RutF, flavin reductase (DIM6/NTAB) family [Saccharopolyspora antimicrobica]